ncbi:DNA-3-methyladenine glycosylase 2 family protein [Caulobacter sp. 17J65-9]|uniref:DNA-3-methyladenine glycosylase family protein n=1 Tax=Caulobacter sp. 17J65-9 TaxID=2709382 RepID=UPI0013C69ED9|nr:DNA-3-methyladenine glycosylase 2 family protein [Caulobacter sp. 17J65-9]NEX92172.1 DNA-3-methyladenine glycosylase 2 family protein [Caulobacter sp. 17J65-9]
MIVAPSAEDLFAARAALVALDPALAHAHAVTPAFEWRTREGGFAGLMRMLVEQQVSTASAAAIWRRVEAGLGEIAPAPVLAREIEDLRALGLSLPKARYAHAIAEACATGALDFAGLRDLPDAEAIARLTAVKGIGRWTAEIYLMFCEGRADIFPGGDIALQEAMRWADRAERRPSEREAAARAELWRPHRSVAAHLLWRWYGGVKRGELSRAR